MQNQPKEFLLPASCEEITRWFDALTDGYSELLDGQIDYKPMNGHYLALQLFGDVSQITEHEIDEAKIKVTKKLELIGKLHEKIINTALPSPTLKQIYLDALEEYRKKFLMLFRAIPLEAAKWGYELDNATATVGAQRSESYNHEIWGLPVSENIHEVKWIMEEIHRLYDTKKENISQEEQAIFAGFLSHIQTIFSSTDEEITSPRSEKTSKKNIKNPALTKKIFWPTHQKYIFEQIIASEAALLAPDASSWRVKLDPSKSSMSTDQYDRSISIPGNADNMRSVDNVLAIFSHEFGKHAISGMNANKFFGQWFKWKGYLPLEEGFAKIFEHITTGDVKTLDDLASLSTSPALSMITTFVAEQYNLEDAINIMHIYRKLSSSSPSSIKKETVMASLLRAKRFFPLHTPWASTKDLAYTRWLTQAIYVLQEAETIERMYALMQDVNFAKLWLDDLQRVQLLKQELLLTDEYINQTSFVSRRVYRLISGESDTPSPWSTHIDELIHATPLSPKAQKIIESLKVYITDILNAK